MAQVGGARRRLLGCQGQQKLVHLALSTTLGRAARLAGRPVDHGPQPATRRSTARFWPRRAESRFAEMPERFTADRGRPRYRLAPRHNSSWHDPDVENGRARRVGCATLSHRKAGVRELRNQTSQVINAVRTGERVVLTVHGEAVVDIVPHGQRAHRLPGDYLRRELAGRAADPALHDDLGRLAGQTLDGL